MVKFEIIARDLRFIKPAKTSRNVFKERRIYLLHLWDTERNKHAWAESAPLKMLSIDDVPDYFEILSEKCTEYLKSGSVESLDLQGYPSIKFGLETLHASWSSKEPMQVFSNSFYEGQPIAINGLVWMSDAESMLNEAIKKAGDGFNTMKFKVGALDFDEECRMLEAFRKKFPTENTVVRLDANGAFSLGDAEEKLKELSRFNIHSIEQPIKAGQWDALQEVCAKSAIDVALDEELIGLEPSKEGAKLIKHCKPKYLILKPNLLGGFSVCDAWIVLANNYDLSWWATSALEGNVGLNAIAQWVAAYNNPLPQGLGTGSLYSNNVGSPLTVKSGFLVYSTSVNWELP